MTSARPYRFPAPEPTRRSAGRSCGTCGASAVASCVALCCCPCAVVNCFTLALVKAPYAAVRRCVVRLAKRRQIRGVRRKTKRVRSLVDQQYQEEELAGGAARVTKEWDELGRAGSGASGGNANDASLVGEGCRVRVNATEKLWAEMYQVGHWGFGRLSFSAAGGAATQVTTEGSEKDGNADVGR